MNSLASLKLIEYAIKQGIHYFILQIGIVLFVYVSVSWIIGEYDSDDTDGEVRSGMRLRIDYGTGCQYLESRDGFLIARYDNTGQHICK